jgi:hypothetical protein
VAGAMSCDFNPRWFWTHKNIRDVLKVLESCDKPVFHICSGSSDIGDIRLDRSYIDIQLTGTPRGSANILGDMERLPIKSGVAATVLCDPPYKYKYTEPDLIDELVRICRPNGKIIFIAHWSPDHKFLKMLDADFWKVGKDRPYSKIRSIFRKSNGQLSDYF